MTNGTKCLILFAIMILCFLVAIFTPFGEKGEPKQVIKNLYINYYYEGLDLIKVYYSYERPFYTSQSGTVQIFDTNRVEVVILSGRVESELYNK